MFLRGLGGCSLRTVTQDTRLDLWTVPRYSALPKVRKTPSGQANIKMPLSATLSTESIYLDQHYYGVNEIMLPLDL